MHYYYITGASRGIGKALARALMLRKNNMVYGFSRSENIKHPNYKHVHTDFLDKEQLTAFTFQHGDQVNSATLINNAGTLGEVKPAGKLQNQSIYETFLLNSIAPAILQNQFIRAFEHFDVPKTVLNISSGAARHVVESWSNYCSSKAALDMLSRVAAAEQGSAKSPVRVFSVAPGIVDTQMQSQIRNTKPENFKDHHRFVQYKKQNQLSSPEQAAEQLLKIIDNPHAYKQVELDVRQL